MISEGSGFIGTSLVWYVLLHFSQTEATGTQGNTWVLACVKSLNFQLFSKKVSL